MLYKFYPQKLEKKINTKIEHTLPGFPIHFTSPPSFSYLAANVPESATPTLVQYDLENRQKLDSKLGFQQI